MKVTIEVPSVNYRAARRGSGTYYVDAARKLRAGYDVGGSNVRSAIADLLDAVAEAMDDAIAQGAPTERDIWPCDGTDRCRAQVHTHGCFADVDGAVCDERDDIAHPERNTNPAPPRDCQDCGGAGEVKADAGEWECGSCGGTGRALTSA